MKKVLNIKINFLIVSNSDSNNLLKKQVDDVCTQQSNFSELFYMIDEKINSQTNWLLGDKFAVVLDLIDDHEQRQIITIDNIFTVKFYTSSNIFIFFLFNLLFFHHSEIRLSASTIWKMHIYSVNIYFHTLYALRARESFVNYRGQQQRMKLI